jgi:hypothetical protein
VNYGSNTTIKFGCDVFKEYFNATNIEYYNAILGILFLKKLGAILDFSSPGLVRIGNETVPTGKVSFNNEALKEGQHLRVSKITSGPSTSS